MSSQPATFERSNLIGRRNPRLVCARVHGQATGGVEPAARHAAEARGRERRSEDRRAGLALEVLAVAILERLGQAVAAEVAERIAADRRRGAGTVRIAEAGEALVG